MAAMRLATRISIVFRGVVFGFIVSPRRCGHHWPSTIEFAGKNLGAASEEIPIFPAERGLRRAETG
jgi:hypothetical protein